ncbi:MAG: hypothetical protein M1836_002074 [Candelina mexicana]|nr:MAG: hypothetical protein M1836_002074 [Candelina mexicana]
MFARSLLYSLTISTIALAAQPSAPAPVSAPLRELPWGQLNFLHTTDTHGWHAGHLQEPSYQADWGDYISFAKRMRQKADDQGVDLLLIDSGDRIEGNGLYDASDPKGKWTFEIFKEQDIDVLCSGNHELYKQNSSENEYFTTVPDFKGNYLASNIDIIDPRTGQLVPLAPRYRKFTTKQHGIRIIAFGFLFNFVGNYNNTVVQPVEETIKQNWFQEAIRDREVDLFLVNGHVPVRSKEFTDIYNAIRDVQWDTPIQFFGGHTHIRDYKKYNSKSYALESGRYMETIGFMSIDGIGVNRKTRSHLAAGPQFNRRYIDNNLLSFHHHTGLNESTFPTDHGKNVSRLISHAREALELDYRHGCAPSNLWLNRASYPSSDSVITWLEEQVIPDVVEDKARKDIPRVVIINTGAIRFDVLKGPFTRDTTFIVSPFTSGFRYIKDVPYETAKKLLALLNSKGTILEQSGTSMLGPPEQLAYTEDKRVATALELRHSEQVHLSAKPNLTPGYTTRDDAGTDGDDTLHSPISFHRVPNCVQSEIAFPESKVDPTTVDLVYLEFIQPWILLALKFFGEEYALKDTDSYMEGVDFPTLMTNWVETHWDGSC